MSTPRTTIAALGALLAAAVIAAPAQATVVDHAVVKDEPFAYTSDDCGFEVEIAGTFDEVFVTRQGKHEDDQAYPAISRFGYDERWTNVETGEWFTIKAKTTFVEIRATHVEGTIFEFEYIDAGQPLVIRDSDGELVARNRGNVHATYLFDTLGDSAPGGENVDGSWELVKLSGPHPSFETELCDIAVELIG